jgi:SAM-dependent methyltransferase
MPDASVEGVFLAYVLHDTEDRVAFLSAVRRLLKPGGWFAILNWYRKETEHGPPLEKRIEPDELESLSRDAGFRWRWWRDLNGIQYMAMLRK